MADRLKLLTCSLDDGGPKMHPCRKAHEALDEAGHVYETEVFDKNRPLGLFTKGKRPHLKRISGQEKLPVLQLPGGETIAGGKNIVTWAQDNPPATPAA